MRARYQRFFGDDAGAVVVEWAAVSGLLSVATYAILLAVGSEFVAGASTVLFRIRDFVGL